MILYNESFQYTEYDFLRENEMYLTFLWSGMIIGFSIAAPIGPIGLLCIRKTLQFGRLSGFISGVGAAMASMLYGAIAAFGLTVIMNFFLCSQFWLHLLGGIILIYLGVTIGLSNPPENGKMIHEANLLKDFVSTFFLNLTNPLTIFSYLAVFAGLGVVNTQGDYGHAICMVLGVFLGATLWWFILSEIVSLFRRKLSQNALIWINRLAGMLIAVFGIVALIGMFGTRCA